MQIPMVESPIGQIAIQGGTRKKKAETIPSTIIYRQIGGRLNAERDIYL